MLICVRLIRIHGGCRLRRVGEHGEHTYHADVWHEKSSSHTVVVNPSSFF